MKTITATMTHYCYGCGQKIIRGEEHLISRTLHDRMYYPRFHAHCMGAKREYESTPREWQKRAAEGRR